MEDKRAELHNGCSVHSPGMLAYHVRDEITILTAWTREQFWIRE